MTIGRPPANRALTLAHLPLAVLLVAVLAGLFSAAFRLGIVPPLISLALLGFMILTASVASGRMHPATTAGSRLMLAHVSLVCLLGGLSAAPPEGFAPPMLWSVVAIAAAAGALVAGEAWLTEKTDMAGPFGRQLGHEAAALLVLALAVLLWRSGQVDGWVVLVGVVRYARLALAAVVPALRRGATRWWRPYGPVLVATMLVVALAPAVPRAAAAALGALALVLVLVATVADLRATPSENGDISKS